MGIYDRNYFRGSSGGWGAGPSSWPPVCKAIVLVNICVFIAQITVTRLPTIEEIRDQYGANFRDHFVENYIEEHTADKVNVDADKHRQIADRKYHEFLADQVVNSPRASVVQDWLELDTSKVKQGQIWRILTSAFCHDRSGLWHILFNMLGLIWFGITLEHMYGDREFLLFYLTAAILSGLAFVGLDL